MRRNIVFLDADMAEQANVPLVSVCIVAYNNAPFIRECIEGALRQQASFAFEIIIGDDDSDDGTREICDAYAKNFPAQVRVLHQRRADVIYINNRPTGRNNLLQCLKAAKGKYIALCDGDDYWSDPGKLQKQFVVLESRPEIICCHHWHKVARRNELGVFEEHSIPLECPELKTDPVTTVAVLFLFKVKPQSRTYFFRNIFSEHPLPDWFKTVQFGDLALCFILGTQGNFYFLNEEMAVYRHTGTGVSSIFSSVNGVRQGNQAWMKVWAHAIMHHHYVHSEQALKGMQVFLSRIRKASGNSFGTRMGLIVFVLFKLKLNLQMKKALVVSLLNPKFENNH